MANWNDPQPTRTGFGASPSLNGAIDRTRWRRSIGPAPHMLSIYNYMASGVLLSGVVALLIAQHRAWPPRWSARRCMWLVVLSPLAIVFAMSFGANRMQTADAAGDVLGFAVLMGLSLSTIFLRLHRRVDRGDVLRHRGAPSPASACSATPPRRTCRAWARS